jgi:hypothetical protein
VPKVRRLVQVEPGSDIEIRLHDQLDTETTSEEQRFTATLSRDVKAGRRVVIEKGATVEGVVRRVDKPGRTLAKARLDLELVRIEAAEGWISLTTQVLTREKSDAGNDAKRVAGGAAIGAIIGALSGGKRGAKRGVGIGAGAGAAGAVATRGPDVILRAGSKLEFELQQPLLVEIGEDESR